MGIEYYLFATYVFLLVCIVLVIGKHMFADVKRQRRMLEDKEKKLLRTYQTLEDAMDDFYDTVEDAKKELNQKSIELEAQPTGRRQVLHEITEIPKQFQVYDAPLTPPSQPYGIETAPLPVFDQILSDSAEKAGAPLSALHEKILDLSGQGKSHTEIAKCLEITQNEVDLVIGMNKTAEMA